MVLPGDDRAQLGLRTILAAFVVVIAAMAGVLVVDDIAASVDLDDGDTVGVTNESAGTVVFTANNTYNYTVSNAPTDSNVDSVLDDESVFNTTSDTQLTEGTDYWWDTSTGELRVNNTSAVGNNTADTVITYNYVENTTELGGAQNSVVSGFADMIDLVAPLLLIAIGTVIIALIRRVQ